MSSIYPWIKDSQDLSPSIIGYLAVTSPNGLYLKESSPTTTPFTNEIKYNEILMISQNLISSFTNTLRLQPGIIQQITPSYNMFMGSGTFTTQDLTGGNRTSSLTPLECRLGFDGGTNLGKLYCLDIDCGANLNVVTINGLIPTTIGLNWSDFNNAYPNLLNGRYYLSDTTYETYQDTFKFYSRVLVGAGEEASFSFSGINSQAGGFTIQTNGQILNLNCGALYINGSPYSPGGGGGSQDLSSVLSQGNNAGGQDIYSVNNINLSTINGSSYPPFPTSPYGLPSVLSIDNTASTSINMNSQDINSVNNINVNSINGSSYPIIPQFIYAMPFQYKYVNNTSQEVFPNGITIQGGFTYAITWTFWYDVLYQSMGSQEMIDGYGDIYSYSFGSISGSARKSGINASSYISTNNMYRTTITYTDNDFVVNNTETYYPYIYQANTLGWSGTIYCSATISRTN